MLVNEILHLMLEGAREDFVVKQMGDKIAVKYKSDTKRDDDVEGIINQISQKADPSSNKQNLLWIARMYVNNNFRWEDLIRIREILQEFERVKGKLKNKDINSYKTPTDVVRAIEPFKDQEIISGKQAVNRGLLKHDINSPEAKRFFETGEAELFYSGSTLNVVVPKTQNASCFFGMNTEWCTARNDDENMFKHYNNNGPLYIVICKDGNRYQFHFDDDENHQFMDKYDNPVDVVKLGDKYEELYDAFEDIAIKRLFLPLIKNQTEQICIEAARQNGLSLRFIRNQTDQICLEAVKQNGFALEYVKNQTERICLAAVRQTGWALKYVKNQTERICLAAVRLIGAVLQFVKNQTEEICLTAVKQNSWALQYVKNQTEEICLTAARQNESVIKFINDDDILERVAYKLTKEGRK